MRIEQKDFFMLLSGINQYQIPIYQRNYAWKKDQCQRLLDDIVKAGKPGNPNHYIGSVIVKSEGDIGGVNVYNVIDGQQRTTTITLLLLALTEYWSTRPLASVQSTTAKILENIKQAYLTNVIFSGSSLFTKVLPKSGNDRIEYDNLLHGVIGNGAISANYSFFLHELESKAYNQEEIYNGIKNSQLALVTLDANENPQLLFEAVNDTGVDLTDVDLVRNWIFMGLSGTDQDKLYREYWEPIEKLSLGKTDKLLFYFTQLKSESSKAQHYYNVFKKKFILYAGSAEKVENLLKEIKKYAELYKMYITTSSKNKPLKIILERLINTKKDVFTPLILKILYQLDLNILQQDDAMEMLNYIEAYIVRRDILTIPTNSLGEAMISLLKNCGTLSDFTTEIKKLKDSRRMPDDTEMHTQLQLKDFYNLSGAYGYLERIEKFLNPAFSLDDPTIEHILPETMHTTSFPKKGVSPNNVDDYNWELDLGAEAQAIHDKYQHTIGNLTILPRRENSRMGDLRFEKKQKWSNISSGGFNYGYLYTPIRISQSLGKNAKWDESAILARCAEMVNYICQIWPHP